MTDISTNINLIIPSGVILPFAGTSALAPEGWVMCDGSEYSSTNPKYSKLYSIIGILYGGTGSTFKVPNINNDHSFIRPGTTLTGIICADTTKISTIISSAGSAHQHANTVSISNSGQSADHTHGSTNGQSVDHTHGNTNNVNPIGTSGGGLNHHHKSSGDGGHVHILYEIPVNGGIVLPGSTSYVPYRPTPSLQNSGYFPSSDGTHSHSSGNPYIGIEFPPYESANDLNHSHSTNFTSQDHSHSTNFTSQDHSHANTVSISNVDESSHTHTISNSVLETAPRHIYMQYIIKL